MTAREMQAEFDTRLQLVMPSAETTDKPDSTTIFMFLNKSQDQYVESKYSGNNQERVGFEQNQKLTDELRTLVVETILTVSMQSGGYKPNSYSATLPSDYLHTISEEVSISAEDFEGEATTYRVGIIECTADNYRSHIDDPYSEHVYHYEEAKPLRLFRDNKVELITDGNYSVLYYFLRYLKIPTRISLDGVGYSCPLPANVHTEIVDLAVGLFLQSISTKANAEVEKNQS